jgi:hypothetical protein
MVPSEFKVNAGFETVVVKITSDGLTGGILVSFLILNQL